MHTKVEDIQWDLPLYTSPKLRQVHVKVYIGGVGGGGGGGEWWRFAMSTCLVVLGTLHRRSELLSWFIVKHFIVHVTTYT